MGNHLTLPFKTTTAHFRSFASIVTRRPRIFVSLDWFPAPGTQDTGSSLLLSPPLFLSLSLSEAVNIIHCAKHRRLRRLFHRGVDLPLK
jgi:hypothetical protein